ncbi:MAG TPA: exodeoxyribonuclease VII small subunit [Candidatus Nanopelagicaceae bacterium]|nr:exodeoxyribonuclease VII small subunit [Candidatus Nanopelagicaceae bacterium]
MERDPDAFMTAAAETSDLDYESALGELDQVLANLEDGRVALEDAMALYERGVGLVRRCASLLDGAEKRVTELAAGPDGALEETPFEARPEDGGAG